MYPTSTGVWSATSIDSTSRSNSSSGVTLPPEQASFAIGDKETIDHRRLIYTTRTRFVPPRIRHGKGWDQERAATKATEFLRYDTDSNLFRGPRRGRRHELSSITHLDPAVVHTTDTGRMDTNHARVVIYSVAAAHQS